MKNAVIIFCTMLCLQTQMATAQYVNKLVELDTFETTGKRHQSYFFTFRTLDSTNRYIRSQEIFWDFGAKQILSKIYGPESFSQISDNKRNVIISYSCQESEGPASCQIKWVAEPYREKSLTRLEMFLQKYSNEDKLSISEALLKEMNGQTFLIDYKIAFEVYLGSGHWKVAKIED